ncbi:LOW QUALITY PROTEIN: reverse transcriptase [Phytophthora megakarya]|uniref:Reverse transcriptase n=1 Tax=Phytophthora megakarya TaxID=4795 RepID=A0A225WCX6_9STRA|nr:LOW QUALITY PROTEIN: reverse transcriptase [Phytophthora megakarya]
MFYTIIIPASNVDIRRSAVLTIGSGIIFTGEDCTGACKDMSGSVRIARLEKGDPGPRANRRIIAMDHIPSLSRSYKANTTLLIFEDIFYGNVIAKASGSRMAQTVAESYEECVFRRFGASEVIRHDRVPGFMSDFFRAFYKTLDQRQRATMAYRSKAYGSAERIRDMSKSLWHGALRVAEKIGEYAVKLEIAGFAYNIFPVVHVSKIKPVREFPDRPVIRLTTQDQDRLDFDEALFPGDSLIQDRDPDE